ncbi:MAG: hypothetical protein KJI71_01345 [Patescibacteria group bacterium]|nr:hypothetical protein [Patescibacteria group bacterium]
MSRLLKKRKNKPPYWSQRQTPSSLSTEFEQDDEPVNIEYDFDPFEKLEKEGWWKLNGVWVTEDFVPTIRKSRFPPKYLSTENIVKRDRDMAKGSILQTLSEMDAKMLVASLRHEDTMLEARPIYTKDIYRNIVFTLVIITNIMNLSYDLYVRHWMKAHPEFSFSGKDLFLLFKDAKYEIEENW